MTFEISKRERGTFKRIGLGANGQWTLEASVKYFRCAAAAVAPEQLGDALKELLKIAHNPGVENKDRISAIKVIVNTFLPKNWQEIYNASTLPKGVEVEYTPEFLRVLADQANQAIHKQADEAAKARDAGT